MFGSRTTREVSLVETLVTIVVLSVLGVGLVLPSPPKPESPQLVGAPTGDVLQVAALGVEAPLVSVRMSKDATLDPPRDPHRVGYWVGSSAPGALTGQTLVTGHTVHTGGGAMDKVGTLKPGASVVIFRKYAGQVQRTRYVVTGTKVYSKAQLSAAADQLFRQDIGKGRLLLVTCTGWDGKEYYGNVVVTAKRLGTEVAQA